MEDQNDLNEDEELMLHESSVRVWVVRALAFERERERVCRPTAACGCRLEYGLVLLLLVAERGVR